MTRPAPRIVVTWAIVVAGVLPAMGGGSSVAAFQVPQSSGRISGVVRDSATRKAVAGALVALVSTNYRGGSAEHTTRLQVITATDGAFLFSSVAPGTYLLSVAGAGYAAGYFGQEHPDEPRQYFDLRAGEDAKGIALWLTPGGAISGTVRTTGDAPAARMSVRAIALESTSDGRPALRHLPRSPARTDNRGEYRLADLPPGKYLLEVSAGVAGAGQFSIEQFAAYTADLDPSTIYYPDAPTPVGARPIDVEAGAEVPAINFVVETTPKPAIRVAGRLTGAPFDLSGQTLRLVTTDRAVDLPSWLELATTRVGPNGAFAFPYVPPGTYELRGVFEPGGWSPAVGDPPLHPRPFVLLERPSQPPAYWCRQEVTVLDTALADLVVPAQAGMRVRGRMMLTGDVGNIDRSGLPITARSLDGWTLDPFLAGRTQADGTFASVALPPGRYLIQAHTEDHAVFTDAALLFGRDVTATGVDVSGGEISGLELTVTRARTHVTGSVHDAAGKERPDALVIYFRVAGAWQQGLFGAGGSDVGSVRTDRFGAYDIQLPSGDYYTIAVAGSLPIGWQNQEFLRALVPLASKVSLARGASVREDLTVRPMPTVQSGGSHAGQ